MQGDTSGGLGKTMGAWTRVEKERSRWTAENLSGRTDLLRDRT